MEANRRFSVEELDRAERKRQLVDGILYAIDRTSSDHRFRVPFATHEEEYAWTFCELDLIFRKVKEQIEDRAGFAEIEREKRKRALAALTPPPPEYEGPDVARGRGPPAPRG
jgi:hypothetical protein